MVVVEMETQFMKRTMEIVLISGLLLSGCTVELKEATPAVTLPVKEEVNSCQEIHAVSDPVIVRDANVGDAAPYFLPGYSITSIDSNAFYPKAISTDAGILVIWRVSFDGQKPEPNVFMRLLDEHAVPIGEVQNLFERNMVGQSYSLLKVENKFALGFCGRYGYEDQTTRVFLNSQGEVLSEQPLPTDLSCGIKGSPTVSTGPRLITTWMDQIHKAVLNIADQDGNSLILKELPGEADHYPQVAVGHDRILVVVNSKSSEHSPLMIHRFDLDGNELGDPVIINPLTFELDGIIREKSFTTPSLIPTPDGWMLLSSPRSWSLSFNGIYVAHLAPDGALVSGPFITGLDDPDLGFSNGIEQVFPYGQGAMIWGHNLKHRKLVIFVSKHGVVNPILNSLQEPDVIFHPFFFEHQEKIFAVYTKKVDVMTNQVLLREVACTP
jgi:hypothetical protein